MVIRKPVGLFPGTQPWIDSPKPGHCALWQSWPSNVLRANCSTSGTAMARPCRGHWGASGSPNAEPIRDENGNSWCIYHGIIAMLTIQDSRYVLIIWDYNRVLLGLEWWNLDIFGKSWGRHQRGTNTLEIYIFYILFGDPTILIHFGEISWTAESKVVDLSSNRWELVWTGDILGVKLRMILVYWRSLEQSCHRVVPLSYKLVDDPLSLSGWWLTTTPLKNDGVSNSWDDEHSQWKVISQSCSKPPTRSPYSPSYSHCSWFIAY